MVGVGLWGEPRPSRAPWIPGVPGMSGERVGRLSVGCGLWETVGGSQTRPYKGVVDAECLGVRMALEAEPRPRPMPRGHRVCPVCRGAGWVCLPVGRGWWKGILFVHAPPCVPDQVPARRVRVLVPGFLLCVEVRGWFASRLGVVVARTFQVRRPRLGKQSKGSG